VSAFALKVIAVTAMLLDHTQAVFPDTFPLWFRVVGRLAFPIFAFLIAEGLRHTRSQKKFLLRLFVFALVSEPFFDYAIMGAPGLYGVDFLNRTNVFYTLFLGGSAIAVYKFVREKASAYGFNAGPAEMASCLPAVFFLWLGAALDVDYNWVGVLFIFAMYAVKKTHARLVVMAGMCLLIWLPVLATVMGGFGGYFSATVYAMIAATLLTVPLAARYNGKRGPGGKWFFYVFYPAHLALLGGVYFL
jgi:hypothetical protein